MRAHRKVGLCTLICKLSLEEEEEEEEEEECKVGREGRIGDREWVKGIGGMVKEVGRGVT